MQLTFLTYLVLGLSVALWLCLFKINMLTDQEDKPTWGFRLIIMPGIILLWPIVIHHLIKRP